MIVIAVTIYSRPGCHLCDDMKDAVRRIAQTSDERIAIEEIDVSGDSELEARYGVEVPVLLVDGRKVAKYRITEDALRRALKGHEGKGQ